MFVNVRLRKWGNSLGAVIPKHVVDAEKLRENDTVVIKLEDVRANLGRELFGSLKLRHTGQQVKDDARNAWSRW